MTKEGLLAIIKDLTKIFLVVLLFEIVWPDAVIKDVGLTDKLFLQHIFKRFLTRGIPIYLVNQTYFFINRDKYDFD